MVVASLFSPLGCFGGSGGDDEVEPLVVIEGAGAVTSVTMPVDRPLQVMSDFSPFGGDGDIFEITFPEDGEFTYTARWATFESRRNRFGPRSGCLHRLRYVQSHGIIH